MAWLATLSNPFCVCWSQHSGLGGHIQVQTDEETIHIVQECTDFALAVHSFWQSCPLKFHNWNSADLSPCLLPSIRAGPMHHETLKSDLCQLEIKSLLLQSTWERDGERWSSAPLASRLLTSAERFKPSLNKVCGFNPHPEWPYWSQRIPPEDICMGKKLLEDKQSLILLTCPSGALSTSSSWGSSLHRSDYGQDFRFSTWSEGEDTQGYLTGSTL